jgi:hypothetical protein
MKDYDQSMPVLYRIQERLVTELEKFTLGLFKVGFPIMMLCVLVALFGIWPPLALLAARILYIWWRSL